jgi:hypothetical protein
VHIVLNLRLWSIPIHSLHFHFQYRVLFLLDLWLRPVCLYCLRWIYQHRVLCLLDLWYWLLPIFGLLFVCQHRVYRLRDLRLWSIPIFRLHFHFQHRVLGLHNLRFWHLPICCMHGIFQHRLLCLRFQLRHLHQQRIRRLLRLQQWLLQGLQCLHGLYCNLHLWHLPNRRLLCHGRHAMRDLLHLRRWPVSIRCLHFHQQHRVLCLPESLRYLLRQYLR